MLFYVYLIIILYCQTAYICNLLDVYIYRYVYAWYELNEKWIKYGIIILKYGIFILFGQTCDEGTCHVGTLWPGYRGIPSSQVLLFFHPILTYVFRASIMQVFFQIIQIIVLLDLLSKYLLVLGEPHE